MSQQDFEEESSSQAEPEETATAPVGPEGPSPPPRARRRFGGWRIWTVLGALVVIVAAAVGAYLYINRVASFPPEQTARFLPHETPVYLSINLRPGAGQLMKFRDILSRYEENPDFRNKVDDGLEKLEDITGIYFPDDLNPWIGPEIAIAVVDFAGFEEIPEVVAFLGTTDPAAAEDFLLQLMDYLEEEADLEFEQGRSGEFTTYSYDDPSDGLGLHFAVTDEYLVFATSDRLLDSTIGMMAESTDSLADNGDFKRAQDSAQSPRFEMLYVDVDSIVRDARRALEGSDQDVLDRLEDFLPGVVTMSAALIDMGIKVTGSYDTPKDSALVSKPNSQNSAASLPSDTLALLSLAGVRETWEQLEDQPENFSQIVDIQEVRRDFEEEIGLDLERDIIDWMTGELAFALLPSEFELGPYDDIEDVLIHAVALIEFDDRAAVERRTGNIVEALEDQGVEFDEVSIGGEDALLVDLREEFFGYEPGFLITDKHVVVGTTRESLEDVMDTRDGAMESLKGSREYERIKEIGGRADAMLYANVAAIVEMIVDALGPSGRADYREEGEPFVEPIRSFFFGGETDEGRTTWTVILTFE